MSLKDLPQVGQNFSAKANIGGHMSLHTKLTHLSHQAGVLNVLKDDDVSRITDKFDNPLIKRAVRYQGGLSNYQARALKHQLTGDHLKDPHNFSAYKLKVAKKIVDHYKKQPEVSAPAGGDIGAGKPAAAGASPALIVKPRPILHLAQPPVVDTISPPHQVSINSLGHRATLTGAGENNPLPTTPHRPPPIKLVI